MILIAVVIISLPFILMTAFNHGDRTDARGRRTNTRWTSARR
jgi:hypothetical protein